jgi:hypothetical protein
MQCCANPYTNVRPQVAVNGALHKLVYIPQYTKFPPRSRAGNGEKGWGNGCDAVAYPEVPLVCTVCWDKVVRGLALSLSGRLRAWGTPPFHWVQVPVLSLVDPPLLERQDLACTVGRRRQLLNFRLGLVSAIATPRHATRPAKEPAAPAGEEFSQRCDWANPWGSWQWGVALSDQIARPH